MSSKDKNQFTAHTLMIIMTALLFVIFIATIAGFIYFRGTLEKYADEISTVSSEAESTQSRVQQLQKTEIELKKHSVAIDRAARIVAESKSYQYQNQIINDITNYAERADVSITSFTFGDASNAPTAPVAPPTAAPPVANPQGPATAGAAPKSTTVTINLGDSVPYENLLNFLTMIEKNLTKMQIANVSLSKSSDGDANEVALQSLNLEVYVK